MGFQLPFPQRVFPPDFWTINKRKKMTKTLPSNFGNLFQYWPSPFGKKQGVLFTIAHTKNVGFFGEVDKTITWKRSKMLILLPRYSIKLNWTTWVSKLTLLRLVCPLPPLRTTILRHNVTKHHHSQNLLPGMARFGKEGARPCFTSGDGREWNGWAKSYGKRAGMAN